MTSEEHQPETTIWEGRPSQWSNFGWFAACLLVLPIPYAIYRYLQVRMMRWTLTTHRLRMTEGILHRTLDDLELYRVKDQTLSEPLVQRLVGLGTIHLVTSDATTPTLSLSAIPDALAVMDLIRDQVDRVRRERGVRELDVHDGDFSPMG
jgi:uncharacterized membrane protein YdbT with pleckstrin-like domain